MSWNKVRARIKYKSGEFEAFAYADASLHVGDIVECIVVSGYTTTCQIRAIISSCDKPKSNSARIISKKPINQTTIKEEKTMVNDLFVTVFVQHPGGYVTKCQSMVAYEEGQEVVYEGKDHNLHVGSVIVSHPPRVDYAPPTGNYTCGGFIAQVVIRTQLDECRKKEILYSETVKQLQARKKMMEERAIWELLAEKDPEAKKLLAQLDELKTNLI
jgi:hypothetical protein